MKKNGARIQLCTHRLIPPPYHPVSPPPYLLSSSILLYATVPVAMPGLEIPGEFLRHAVLETVVPHAPGLDIEGSLTSALEDGADDLPSVLSSIPQRSLLFFGMLEMQSTATWLLLTTGAFRRVSPRSHCSEALRLHGYYFEALSPPA